MNRAIYGPSFPISVSNSRHYLIIFILWPFLAFLTAIFNYGQKEAKRVVFIYLVYYGFVFVIVPGMDSSHYASELKRIAELPFSDFFRIVGGLYTETSVDIMQPLITFFVSRFTSHHAFLFAVWAALFSFFT